MAQVLDGRNKPAYPFARDMQDPNKAETPNKKKNRNRNKNKPFNLNAKKNDELQSGDGIQIDRFRKNDDLGNQITAEGDGKSIAGGTVGTSSSYVNRNTATETKNPQDSNQTQARNKLSFNPRRRNAAEQNVSLPHQGERFTKYPVYSAHDKHPQEDKDYLLEQKNKRIEEHRRKKLNQYLIQNPKDLIMLERNKIFPLEKVKVDRRRNMAELKCEICNYTCNSLGVASAHIEKDEHRFKLMHQNQKEMAKLLPPMTEPQLAVLNKWLFEGLQPLFLDPEDLETRRTITVLVAAVVAPSGCNTRLFGSSAHGLGVKISDVNIDLQVPEGSQPSAKLREASTLLSNSKQFKEVKNHFDSEFPYVSFKYNKSGEECLLSLNNERAVNLSMLISKYTPLDPRLTQLAVLFRMWSRHSGTDIPEALPGYAFYLMTIFYLQQCKDPVLPVLNEFLTEKSDSQSANNAQVLSLDVSEIKKKWETRNKQSLAELWQGILKFYTWEFNYRAYIVTIDSSELVPRCQKKLYIVDPFLPTRNVARTILTDMNFDHIMKSLLHTCLYFLQPQHDFSRGVITLNLLSIVGQRKPKFHPDVEAVIARHNHISSLIMRLIAKTEPVFDYPLDGWQDLYMQLKSELKSFEYYNLDKLPMGFILARCASNLSLTFKDLYNDKVAESDYWIDVPLSEAVLINQTIKPQYINYRLSGFVFCPAPECCSICKLEGHSTLACPLEKNLPDLPTFKQTPEQLEMIDQLCNDVFANSKHDEEETKMRERICEEIEAAIRQTHSTARIQLFGSTRNGFGLKASDLDLCLTFQDNKTGEGLDTRGFIEELPFLLRRFKIVYNILAITTAKVPIMKFTHRETKMDGDISLYNILAMENTKLLNTYAQIDERTRILGYMLKKLAKICQIGDASKGSLSSYAYTLMVIFYLQQCDPPVLPVLQEITLSGESPPRNMVEDCNAYFFSDLSKLEEAWPGGRGQNTLSVGSLWLNLLDFYTREFDMVANVVSIRTKQVVTKFDKLWISKGIAIEDPFDQCHNLGSGLTRKMSLYIIKALRKSRNHFWAPANIKNNSLPPVRIINDPISPLEDYYFSKRELNIGDPPCDRGCRFCKSIGHREKSCPEKAKQKGKHQRKREVDKRKPENPRDQERKISKDINAELHGSSEDDVNSNDSGTEDEHEKGNLKPALNDSRDSPSNNRQSDDCVPMKNHTRDSESDRDRRNVLNNKVLMEPSSSVKYSVNSFKSKKGERMSETKEQIHSSMPVATHEANQVSREQSQRVSIPKPQRGAGAGAGAKKPQNVLSNNLAPQRQNVPSQSQAAVDNSQIHIPTVVFCNSKIANAVAAAPIAPPRFAFPPGQETARPPPGFIPVGHNNRGYPNTIPHPHEQPLRPNSWSFEGLPVFANRSPSVEMAHNVPILTPPYSPRPPMCPPFNSQRFTGMLAPKEQMIWGGATAPATAPPSHLQALAFRPLGPPPPTPTQLHTLEASMTNVQINAPSIVSASRDELKAFQQDFSRQAIGGEFQNITNRTPVSKRTGGDAN